MSNIFYACFFITFFRVSLCDRRITNGKVVENGKNYMVYLLNSQYSQNQPDSWLCGGVIISPTQVLTAAACLTEVTHIYVIAGYKKYVSGNNIDKDECTRTRKQKIVKIIVYKDYNATLWIKFDIGIGIVEKPYNFLDTSYRTVCSYEPEAISINYDIKIETANSFGLVLGWGAARPKGPDVNNDTNSVYLKEAYTVLTNKSFCRNQIPASLEYYFLCTQKLPERPKERTGSVGVTTQTSITPDKCDYTNFNMSLAIPKECLEIPEVLFNRKANEYQVPEVNTSIGGKMNDSTLNNVKENQTVNNKNEIQVSQLGGICQNDHGGPLITTAGNKEIVMGIALNSVYNKAYQCMGPYLFLSTARSSVLLKCLLSSNEETRRVCKSMKYDIKEYDVIWPDANV
ncbi:unnamed protein product [Spodoptera littoralis]|uniref:Peptidase S1 domain-containing protein n=1 Tax=Spodoptera littoralis TaxID=7109 RepID=A0A9P0N4S1_SPOLI|nr:unnamed protein product [Spodoptera littoralis]CAH1641519.1 unnamed protein product [Spodoptera littoralis]